MKTVFPFRALCLLFFMIMVCSCSKTKTTAESNDGLAGTWQWVSTDGGIGNNIHDTPASTGENIEMVITTDDKYLIYTNGILTSGGTYSFTNGNCIHDHADKKVIVFSNPSDPSMMIEKVNSFTLELSDNVYDGTNSLYDRK